MWRHNALASFRYNDCSRARKFRSRPCALYPIVVVGLNTAMRRDEVRKLQWQQINLIERILTVGKAKTRESTGRRIPLNSATIAVLEMWRTRFPNASPRLLRRKLTRGTYKSHYNREIGSEERFSKFFKIWWT